MVNMNKAEYLKAIGIETWQPRDAECRVVEQPVICTDTPKIKHIIAVEDDTWASLQAQAEACHACDLAQTRNHVVFGVGNQQADLLIVGEAPGVNEDKQGELFVGRAGQLLNNMLLSIGLQREQIYIANVLKCHPPSGRDPQAEELSSCVPFLERQIALLQPKIILILGRAAHVFI
jgi:DNA polymerase